MIELALVPLLTSVLIAAAGPRLARPLPGRWATSLLTAVAMACSLSTGVVLAAFGALALAEWSPLAVLGHWSAAALAARDPVSTSVAVGCGCVAILALGAAAVQATRSVLGFVRSARLCDRLGAEHPGGLVVLDSPAPQAYALPGRPGRTVVTRAMLRNLSGAERRALLAHEAAHVGHRHFLYVHAARLAAAGNPLLARLVPAVELAAERWADAEAAAVVGDRRLVARTLARASLVCAEAPPAALAALGSEVGQRIEALLAPPAGRRARGLAVVALLAAGAACLVSSGVVELDLQGLVEWARTIAPGRR